MSSEPRQLNNPFPGPQPYRAADRDRFHGREVVARELTSTILAHRCVALFGPSGAGKSSVMQAAVLPTLDEDHDFRVVAIDGWPTNEGPVAWLVEVLLRDLRLTPPNETLGVFESVEWIVDQAFYRSDRPVLIVLDQIEQLLFAQRNAEDVADFFDWLDRFAGQPLRGLHLVLAMREDYLGRFRDRARGRHRLLENGFRLGPLTVGEITGAVIKSAAAGVPPQTWSRKATRRLMLQVRVPGQSERDDAEVQTAFAQIVCRALFAQRAASDVEHETEGPIEAEPILHNYLEGALAALGPLRGPAEQLLENHLVAADGTRTLLTEEAARASSSASDAELNSILTDLESAAILRAEQHRGTRYFELGHDWLAKRVFDRKQERLARAEEAAREAERLAEQRAAEEALTRARAETRRARKVVAIVTVFGLLAAVLGVVAWLQREAALAAEASVRAERDRANELLETAKGITRELLLEALPKYEDIPGTADVQRELHDRLKTILQTLRNDAGDDPDVLDLEIQQKIKRGDLAMTHERLDDAREEFLQALALAERFTAKHPDDLEEPIRTQHGLLLGRLASVEVQAGNLNAARNLYERMLLSLQEAADISPADSTAQRNLAVSLKLLGDMDNQAGDLSAARNRFERSLKIDKALAAASPNDARAQRDLSATLTRLGDLEIRAGDLPTARSFLVQAHTILVALAAANATSAKSQRDLAVSLNRLGNLEVRAGDLPAARIHLQRSFEVSEALASADPSNAQYQRDLAASLSRLGSVELRAGNLPAAQALFERAFKAAESLAAAEPTSAKAQRKLSISLNQLGSADMQAGDLTAARNHYTRALEIRESLAAANPSSATAQRDLSSSLSNLGDVEARAGNLATARELFNRSLSLQEELAADNPTSAITQRNLSYALMGLGSVEIQANNIATAHDYLERAMAHLEPLSGSSLDNADTSFQLVEVHLAFLDLARKEKNPEARRGHAEAAKTLLDAMATHGQVAGFKDREAAMKRINKELAAMTP